VSTGRLPFLLCARLRNAHNHLIEDFLDTSHVIRHIRAIRQTVYAVEIASCQYLEVNDDSQDSARLQHANALSQEWKRAFPINVLQNMGVIDTIRCYPEMEIPLRKSQSIAVLSSVLVRS
jgi:hypothetical protein